MQGCSWDLIYVIEGDDGTREIVQRFAAQRPEIQILYQRKPSGLGTAFRRGFAAVPFDADVVVTLDADLNHQPEDIPVLIKSLRDRDADMVIGSRKMLGSRVEGSSWWKTLLSNMVNRWMRHLMSSQIQDQTSGFRVYRGDLLRSLEFRNSGFAFLPELLMVAEARSACIVEEPILFTFRTVGKSKMNLIPTGLSYVRLFLLRALNVWTLGAVGLLLAGFVLRLALIYPPHKLHGDSDAVLAGLCALDIMDGNLPVFFPGGMRLSAQSCYATAFFFNLFGISRLALTLPSLLFSCIFNIFMYLFFRETLGSRLAFMALFFIVLPPLNFLLVTYPPWAYAEIYMFCAGALWLGVLLAKKDAGKWVAFFYGLCVGLALWSSLQSLMILLPQWGWFIYMKKLRIDSKMVWVMAGCTLGFSPWLLFVASYGIASIFGGQFLRPSTGWQQVLVNFKYLIEYNLPVLLFNRDAGQLSMLSRQGLQAGLCTLAILPFIVFLFEPLRRINASRKAFNADLYRIAIVCVAIVLTVMVLYSFSGAGAVRGWTVRYIMPIYLALATAWAIGLSVLLPRFPGVTWCIAVAIALINVPDYPVLNHPVRRALEAATTKDQKLIEVLQENDIQAVVGDYWQVYFLNFLTRRSIAAIPTSPGLDYLGYGDKLNGQAVRWALISNSPNKIRKWTDNSRLQGRLLHICPDIHLFLPSPNPPVLDSSAFLKVVQNALR